MTDPVARLAAPMTAPALAVTGSTGRLGGRVARRLAAAGVPQRLVAREPARAPVLEGAAAVQADYADPEAGRRALAGVRTLFMVSAAEASDRVDQHRCFIDAAAAAGVRHVVYTSFSAAAPDATFTLGRDHWATEQHLRVSGMDWTFLRDNLYLDLVPQFADDEGVIRAPAGDGRFAGVALDDVADVAVEVLADPGAHRGSVHELTGPEPLTLHAMAEIVTRVSGRTVRYQEESLEEAYRSRASYGAPDWLVEAWVSTYVAIASGELARVSRDVEHVTGHPATSLETMLRG